MDSFLTMHIMNSSSFILLKESAKGQKMKITCIIQYTFFILASSLTASVYILNWSIYLWLNSSHQRLIFKAIFVFFQLKSGKTAVIGIFTSSEVNGTDAFTRVTSYAKWIFDKAPQTNKCWTKILCILLLAH